MTTLEEQSASRPVAAGPGPRDDSALLRAIVERIDCGVLLLDRQRTVRFANRQALAQCRASDALALEQGRLHARDPRDAAALEAALARAARGAHSMPLLARGTQALAVMPAAADADGGAANVLVILGKRSACTPLSLALFAQAHRLSGAESEILASLCQGLRPAEVARRHGVALSTVRSQIGSIRAKTTSRSIFDLLNKITALPPVLPVVATVH
jgi:DNA-binding CsgD family transcriptional regulator